MRDRRAALFLTLASALTLVAPGGECPAGESPAALEPEIRLDTSVGSPDFGTFAAVNLDPSLLEDLERRDLSAADWQSIFAVYTGAPDDAGGRPAVAGTWTVEDGLIRFQPRFPLVDGLTYSARLDLGADGESPLVATFSLPKAEVEPTTVVTAVYPTASVLPENLLRLYVHFSAPMTRGEAYDRARLIEEPSGKEIDLPFVEIAEELWDPEVRRLTLFFDPGRIKRGLRPHDEAGPPLRAGVSYRLVIDAGWPDAQGLPLQAPFEKRFAVVDADRTSPDPDDWRLAAPAAGGREAVALDFPEPLDHGLLSRVLRVRDAEGRPLAGRVEIGDEERRWTFRPDEPWAGGDYEVEVETILEDLAGNNLRYVFDTDLDQPSEPGLRDDRITLAFTVSDVS